MAKLILILSLLIFANANELTLSKGVIQAHTQVFGDSTINPQTKKIDVNLEKDSSIESIKGTFEINPLSLISDNKDRDKHMYEVLKVKNSAKITFNILRIVANDDKYEIYGILQMNHIKKHINTLATIIELDKDVKINGEFSIKLTDFDLEPPSMFFLKVRDQIDIKYSFDLKEQI